MYSRIKYFVQFFNDDKSNFPKEPKNLIITEDNKVIYFLEKTGDIYEYNSKISKLDYQIIDKSENRVKINFTFEDGKKISTIGSYIKEFPFE